MVKENENGDAQFNNLRVWIVMRQYSERKYYSNILVVIWGAYTNTSLCYTLKIEHRLLFAHASFKQKIIKISNADVSWRKNAERKFAFT